MKLFLLLMLVVSCEIVVGSFLTCPGRTNYIIRMIKGAEAVLLLDESTSQSLQFSFALHTVSYCGKVIDTGADKLKKAWNCDPTPDRNVFDECRNDIYKDYLDPVTRREFDCDPNQTDKVWEMQQKFNQCMKMKMDTKMNNMTPYEKAKYIENIPNLSSSLTASAHCYLRALSSSFVI